MPHSQCVYMWWAVSDLCNYRFVCAGEVHHDEDIIKEDIIHKLLCLSVKIPYRFLLQYSYVYAYVYVYACVYVYVYVCILF